jgi:hypothetical protein
LQQKIVVKLNEINSSILENEAAVIDSGIFNSNIFLTWGILERKKIKQKKNLVKKPLCTTVFEFFGADLV